MKFRHKKTGHIYTIVMLAAEEATLTPIVLYTGDGDGFIWSRPAAEFFDGRFEISLEDDKRTATGRGRVQ